MAHLVEGFGKAEDADISLESKLHVVYYTYSPFQAVVSRTIHQDGSHVAVDTGYYDVRHDS